MHAFVSPLQALPISSRLGRRMTCARSRTSADGLDTRGARRRGISMSSAGMDCGGQASCPAECVEEIRSELHMYKYVRGDLAGSVDVQVGHTWRRMRRKPKLVVIAAYDNRMESFRRVKPNYVRICQHHPEVKFLMVNAETFPDLVRGHLKVRSLPTFVLFRGGKRIDHFDARDRAIMEQIIIDNAY